MRVLVAVATVALLAPLSAFAQPAVGAGGPSRAVIVVLRDDVDADATASEHAQRFGAAVSNVYGAALRGYAADVPERQLAALQRDPRVAFVEDDRIGYAIDSVPTGIDRIEADLSSQRSGDGVGAVATGIAIIDSGISAHPDLNIAGGFNCTGNNRKSWSDGTGHGTHVAGIAAARDNGTGVVGVAPGAPVWAVRVLSTTGSGTLSWFVCGIDWVASNAVAKGIKVANISLRFTGSDDGNCGNTNNDSAHRAICGAVAQGVTFAVGAANDNVDFAATIPAAYDEVLTVTGIADFDGRPGGLGAATCLADEDDTAAFFSNWTTPGSSDSLHTIAAPGVCILSTSNVRGGFTTKSGTSMSSPHVAGTVALCISSGQCAELVPAQIVQKLRADAEAQALASVGAYGFAEDPNALGPTRYYGYLVYAGGY
jgi:subtilisin family serine protease